MTKELDGILEAYLAVTPRCEGGPAARLQILGRPTETGRRERDTGLTKFGVKSFVAAGTVR